VLLPYLGISPLIDRHSWLHVLNCSLSPKGLVRCFNQLWLQYRSSDEFLLIRCLEFWRRRGLEFRWRWGLDLLWRLSLNFSMNDESRWFSLLFSWWLLWKLFDFFQSLFGLAQSVDPGPGWAIWFWPYLRRRLDRQYSVKVSVERKYLDLMSFLRSLSLKYRYSHIFVNTRKRVCVP